MNLDREIAKKALTDGFCLLYGEKFRNFFDTVGEEIIELGITNGRAHFVSQGLHSFDKSNLWIHLEHFTPKHFSTVEECIDAIKMELKPFLSENQIDTYLVERPYVSFCKSDFAYPVNNKILFNKISNKLKKVKPVPVKEIPSFDYFKQFPTYRTHSDSVNLYTEGGFGLDQYSYDEVEYNLKEGEHSYLAEAIPYKYHQLGSVLVREELRLELIDRIKNNKIVRVLPNQRRNSF